MEPDVVNTTVEVVDEANPFADRLSEDDTALLQYLLTREDDVNKTLDYAKQEAEKVIAFKQGLVGYFNQRYNLRAGDQITVTGDIIRAELTEEAAAA